MTEIKVTSSQLRDKASELRAQNGEFQSAVEELVGIEQDLMGKWDGESKDQFHTAFNNDKGQMDNFHDVIEQYCQALEASATAYENAEQTNVQTAQNRTYK